MFGITFFSEDLLKSLTSLDQLEGIEQLSSEQRSSVRLIPYQGAGIAGQLMTTFIVDSITIFTPEGDLIVKKPLLGVQKNDLTDDQMYQILIHPQAAIKGISA
ncbi:sigma-E processing peptidase SpoIIGA [Halobacillus andaensis]|uniref:sigma-E processing peptidase SpoIIGA n=1 Tax=Halobacillus andaensis TaxID=1176239 RepID=UPI003D763832